MRDRIVIRQAGLQDLDDVSAILIEAASWLEERGIPLWNVRDLGVEQLREEVSSGLFVLAEANGQPAGTLKYQLEDPLFWPDARDGESAFIHKVAVRRQFAGGIVSTSLLEWPSTVRKPSAANTSGSTAIRHGSNCARFMNGSAFNTTATGKLGRIRWLGISTCAGSW
jgi:hypothetical protein